MINKSIVIIIVVVITESIADNVFLLTPPAKIRERTANNTVSIMHRNNRFTPLKYNNKPILILDDILSELDKNNESLLLKYLNKVEQVFITSTKKYDIENCHYCYLTK